MRFFCHPIVMKPSKKCCKGGPHVILALTLLLLLTACGSTSNVSSKTAPDAGDPEAGKALFNQTQQLTGAPTCKTCHVIEPGEPAIVGPNLSGIAVRAKQRVTGQSARAYIRNSITDPYAYIVPGYQSGIMVRNYEDYLSPQQINDLVAYLMTLE
jgi:cytochrome c